MDSSLVIRPLEMLWLDRDLKTFYETSFIGQDKR